MEKAISLGATFITAWPTYLKNLMGLSDENFYNFSEGAIGFNHAGDQGHQNFKDLLNANLSNISDLTKVKNIIVCGGCNDVNFTYATIIEKIEEFVDFCNTNFPNAKVYIGMVGNFSRPASTKLNLTEQVLTAYMDCNKFGAIYLNGVENILRDYNYMSSDGYHPIGSGQEFLGIGIYQSLKTGYYQIFKITQQGTITDNRISENTIGFYNILSNDTVTIFLVGGRVTYANDISQSNEGEITLFQNLNMRYYKPNNYFLTTMTSEMIIKTSDNKFYAAPCTLRINDSGAVILRTTLVDANNSIVLLSNIKQITILNTKVSIPTKYA